MRILAYPNVRTHKNHGKDTTTVKNYPVDGGSFPAHSKHWIMHFLHKNLITGSMLQTAVITKLLDMVLFYWIQNGNERGGVVVIVHTVCLRMPGFGVVLKFLLALTDRAMLKPFQTPLVSCEWVGPSPWFLSFLGHSFHCLQWMTLDFGSGICSGGFQRGCSSWRDVVLLVVGQDTPCTSGFIMAHEEAMC